MKKIVLSFEEKTKHNISFPTFKLPAT